MNNQADKTTWRWFWVLNLVSVHWNNMRSIEVSMPVKEAIIRLKKQIKTHHRNGKDTGSSQYNSLKLTYKGINSNSKMHVRPQVTNKVDNSVCGEEDKLVKNTLEEVHVRVRKGHSFSNTFTSWVFKI